MASATDLDQVIEKVHAYLVLLRKQNVHFESAYLYGSYSKGTAGPDSDIDLAIVAEDWHPDIIDAQIALMKAATKVDSRIEPHPFRRSDFDESNPAAREILVTGKLVT